MIVRGQACATVDAGNGSNGGREGGAMTAMAEQPPIGLGGRQQRGDRCHSNNRHRDDYDDYANRRAGKDEVAPLDDGWRKRIRRMGNDV